jgi:hypothetical protein
MNLQGDPNAGIKCAVHSAGLLESFVQDFDSSHTVEGYHLFELDT